MALKYCKECGKEISDKAETCPNCGFILVSHVMVPQSTTEKTKGFWTHGRLAIGIISIVLFFFITFQSCAAGINNALQENGATSGTSGFLLAFFMMLAGIIGISTRNSKSKAGAIVSMIFYWFGSILTLGTGETFGDLPIWGAISFVFGLVFLISAIKTKRSS